MMRGRREGGQIREENREGERMRATWGRRKKGRGM